MLLGCLRAILLLVAAQDPLVVYTLDLLPAIDDDDLALRVDLATAVRAVTSDAHEQRQLLRIARFESTYRRDVADCTVAGKEGELSAWQILPTPAVGRAEICASTAAAAGIALRMVRESIRACSHLPPPERLAMYARGRCDSAEGRRLSRARWAP